jgi:AraC-like DNA-binding protein
MGEKVRCSPEHLSRVLKEKLRTGFRDLTREIRMTVSGILLEGGWAVKLVAGLVGFKSVEGFERCFKRCFGITPKDFRKGRAEKGNGNHRNGKERFTWTVNQQGGKPIERMPGELYHIPIVLSYSPETLRGERAKEINL